MAYCPVCEDEFRTGFTRCRDCDAGLVDELPEAPEPEPEAGGGAGDWIRRFGNSEGDFLVEVHRGVEGVHFELVRSFLEGNGVPLHVQTIGFDRVA